ncbi:E3 ubiquitin-protein ligase TRIM39-like isoform X2 [Lissotriton helveticus]
MAPKRKRVASAVGDRTSIRNMAAATPLQSLKEEATCSICLDYFSDPVSVECGHAFCLSCISQCWVGLQTDVPCPQCRSVSETKFLRPNRQLANMVEIAKQLQVSTGIPQEVNMCREHEEKLKLFCEVDQKLICVVCSMSRDHKQHRVLPIREAAQEYKEKFHSYTDTLKKKLEDMLELHRKEEKKLKQQEAKFKSQRERIAKAFEKLKQFLEKENSCYLNNLEQEERNNLLSIKETLTKLEEQQSDLRSMITEIESKWQQQDVELLKDVKSTLDRYENMKAQDASYNTFKGKEESTYVEKEVDLQMKIIESLAAVTLDPETANPWLVLSEDGRSVRLGNRYQDVPDTPQRFDPVVIVLGREKLSSGRHYWEVEVEDKTSWELGVCDEAASRKGEIALAPEEGYWTVRLIDGEYKANTSPSTLLAPRVPSRAVGLFLDYEARRLSVYNVDDRSLLFTFFGASFPPTLRPLFSLQYNDEGSNAAALRILPGTGGK